MLSPADREALILTVQLAGWVTGILLILCTPLAWWLARSRNRMVPVFEALSSLPLVLPPTVVSWSHPISDRRCSGMRCCIPDG